MYREVCSACHSLDRIAWRNLVGVSHTEAEVKAMAEEFEYQDGPDENGQMYMRPGKVLDGRECIKNGSHTKSDTLSFFF